MTEEKGPTRVPEAERGGVPDLEELGARVLSLLERAEYRAARAVLDQLFERGCVAPALVVAYAVCLSELGEGEGDAASTFSLNWSS